MSEEKQATSHGDEEVGMPESRAVSRREFLKIAGMAGAAVGVGAGLGGLLAACGSGSTTTTAGAATTAAAAGTTTAAAGSTTTVSAGAQAGREIKLGYIGSKTGSLSFFGVADDWVIAKWKEVAGDGMVFGDGQKHPVTFAVVDSQSDPNRASQLAGDLINNSKVDLMLTASIPDITIPVSAQCEAAGTPGITTPSPMESWFSGLKGDPKVGFKWVYNLAFGWYALNANSLDIWSSVPTNKQLGGVWNNDIDGSQYRQYFPPLASANGFTLIDTGGIPVGTEDFSAPIEQLKKVGCEVLDVDLIPGDFSVFWHQAIQDSYKPKIVHAGKASLFASGMEAIGSSADGVSCSAWWHPSYPFKSSLTGQTCAELTLDWTKVTGLQWEQPQEFYVLFEWAVDVLKRTKNLDDKEEIIKNVSTTKMADSVVGPIDFTQPVKAGTAYPFPNVAPIPMFYGQWRLNTGQNPWDTKAYMFNLIIVGNKVAPTVPLQGKPVQMPWS